MAKNFIPQLWEEDIIRERDDVIVAAKICNRDYEGKIKEKGDKVKINGVTRPTIVDYDDEKGFGGFERLADQSTMLEITQQKGFSFYVGDIDKKQAEGNFVNEQKREAAAALAQVMDSFVYSEILKEKARIQTAVNELSTANILNVIAEKLALLWAAGVPKNEKVYMECSPNVIAKLMLAKMIVDTDNSKLITSGAVGKLRTFNVEVEMSNNIPAFDKTGEYIVIRSKKAVTLAEQLTEIKCFEPEDFMGEAIKGVQVYGAKVIRPKELITVPIAAFADESAV